MNFNYQIDWIGLKEASNNLAKRVLPTSSEESLLGKFIKFV
jgi:hypothetical protein